MNKQQRVVVTGGAGFIGSHLVGECVRRGARVWVYDDFSKGRREFLPDAPGLTVTEGDILDGPRLARLVAEFRPDVVYHLAAIHHIPTCEADPLRALRVNVEGTQSVLNACAQAPLPRLVFASTGAVYAVAPGALDETAPVKYQELYGISKLCGENLVEYHARRQGAPVAVARFFNTVGRHETNNHVIPDIVKQLAEGKRRVQVGNLDRRRDYVHVQDVAEALVLLGQVALDKDSAVFNIGAGREYSVQQIVDLFAEIIGEPLEAVSVAALQRKIDRPGQLADTRKIAQLAGWRPKRTLRDALADVWAEQTAQGAARTA